MMDLRQGILATAQSLGIDPIDLGTAISYETAGTFDPTKAGPTTQWGQHRGLIQFGEPQAKQYGVDWNDPIGSQLGENGAVAQYLRGAGVKPGMGMMDIYSAINAGSVGRYGASDANNGGAPGTVADKVNGQMAGHREKAMALLGNVSGGGGNTMIAGNPQQDTMKPEGWLTQDRKDALIVGLEGMTMNPNEALVGMAGGRIADRRAEAKSSAAKSKTTEWLRSIGRDDLANAVESGSVDGSTAATVALTPIEPDMPPEAYQALTLRAQAAGLQPGTQEYKDFMVQGGGGSDATATQRDYDFYANQEMKAGRAPLSFNDWDLQGKKAGAAQSNVTLGGIGGEGTKFYDELDKGQATMFNGLLDQGIQADRTVGQIDRLEQVLADMPTGAGAALQAAAGEWGINTDGLDDIQAAQAIINQIVPQQRTPGSGPMSDADLALFKQSVPRLINQPGGNAIILDTMRGIAKYTVQQAEIAASVANRELTPAEGRERLANLVNPLGGSTGKNGDATAPVVIDGFKIEAIK